MQIESCYGRLLRLRPKLRHLNATCGPTPFSRRGKCEFNASESVNEEGIPNSTSCRVTVSDSCFYIRFESFNEMGRNAISLVEIKSLQSVVEFTNSNSAVYNYQASGSIRSTRDDKTRVCRLALSRKGSGRVRTLNRVSDRQNRVTSQHQAASGCRALSPDRSLCDQHCTVRIIDAVLSRQRQAGSD